MSDYIPNKQTGDQVTANDWDSLAYAINSKQPMDSRTYLAQWAYGELYAVSNIVRDVNGAVKTANVVWPDGATGVFTTLVASSAFPGAIDSYQITYIPIAANPLTVTQPTLTRGVDGSVTNQPPLTIA